MCKSARCLSVCAVVWLSAVAAAQGSMIMLTLDSGGFSSENTGAQAVLALEFGTSGFNDWMSVVITNDTPTSIGSKLTAIGLEVPASIVPIGFAGGGTSSYFDEIGFDVPVSPDWLNAPGGWDVMITSDGDFQGGNPGGAPAAGQSQTVIIDLGDTGLTPAELTTVVANYYAATPGVMAIARFQAVGPNGDRSDMVTNPEPASLVLLALGSLALRRRR